MSLKSFNEIIVDEVLKEASKEYAEREDSKSANEVTFSKEHQQKMEKLFKKYQEEEKKTRILMISKKVAVIFLVACIALSGLVITVEAVKKKANESWMQKHGSDYMSIHFSDEPVESVEKESENSYITEDIQFLYLPKGFVVDYDNDSELMFGYRFVNDCGDNFLLRIDLKHDLEINTDLEKVESKEINLDGITVFKKIKDGKINGYVWHDDNYSYTVISNLEEGEILKIIQNIKISKKF